MKRVDPGSKSQKWIKLPSNSKMVILSSSCNFTEAWKLTSSSGVQGHFLKSLDLTKLLTVKKWLKLGIQVPTYYHITSL